MAYSNTAASAITAFFNGESWPYTFDAEKGVIENRFSTNSKLGAYTMRVHIAEEEYMVWSVLGFADERYRKEVARFIARVNYMYKAGYLTINMESGQITHCYHEYFKNRILSKEIIRQSLNTVDGCVDEYGNALYSVMHGELSALAAYNAAKK